ncbi:MAG: pro-sigmaK processing inhibitor BofA family protein [Clostridia bacterium]|nr:pro-sigmaK processing inhibitor BofA family protein [Clostridia bacterium]
MTLYILAFLAVITILFIVYKTSKSPHPFWRAVGSSISGILGFIFVLISYNYTGITLPINLITLSISSLLGVPGVGLLLLLNNMVF